MGSQCGDDPIKFSELHANFGSDRVIGDLAHEAAEAFRRLDGAQSGLDVMIHVALALGQRGRLHQGLPDRHFRIQKGQ